jgi:hypothetical protein
MGEGGVRGHIAVFVVLYLNYTEFGMSRNTGEGISGAVSKRSDEEESV